MMWRWGFDISGTVFHNARHQLRYLFGRGMGRDWAKENTIRATVAGGVRNQLGRARLPISQTRHINYANLRD